MTFSSGTVTLHPLKPAHGPAPEGLLAGVAGLELDPGQDAFVGEPTTLVAKAMADPQRHPFAIVADNDVVGFGTLHVNAATDTGWPDSHTAVLLRGFLVDRRRQGLGYGTAATLAAVDLAEALAAELGLPATGVVLGVNELNLAGQAAYTKAGFIDAGQFLGGRSGPQRIMFRPFTA
jgi:GNAT superfamily N-acetyltransferase